MGFRMCSRHVGSTAVLSVLLPLAVPAGEPPGGLPDHDFRLPVSDGREVIRSGYEGSGLQNLFWKRNGLDWIVYWDEKLRTPRFLSPRTRLVIAPPAATEEELLAAVREFVEANRLFFGVSGADLTGGVVRRIHLHRLVAFREAAAGVPVRGASLRILIDAGGAIASVDAFLLRSPPVDASIDYIDENDLLARARSLADARLGSLERQVIFPTDDPRSARPGWCLQAEHADGRATEMFFSAEGSLLGESDLAQGIDGVKKGKVAVVGSSPDPGDPYSTAISKRELHDVLGSRVNARSGWKGVSGVGAVEFESLTDEDVLWADLVLGVVEPGKEPCLEVPERLNRDGIKSLCVIYRRDPAWLTYDLVTEQTPGPQTVDVFRPIELIFNRDDTDFGAFELLVYHQIRNIHTEAWEHLVNLDLGEFASPLFPLEVFIDSTKEALPEYQAQECYSKLKISPRRDRQTWIPASIVQHEYSHHVIQCMTGSGQADDYVEGVADVITAYYNGNRRIGYLTERIPGDLGYLIGEFPEYRGLVGRTFWYMFDHAEERKTDKTTIANLLYTWLVQRQVASRDHLAFDKSRVLLEQLLVADDSMPNGDGNIRNGTQRYQLIVEAFRHEGWDVFRTRFTRGDVDRTGTVDLTDAVATLQYLFLGGDEDRCLDAMDSDDTGVIDLSDPLWTLSYLFLGMEEPPAPHPGCGSDPTEDNLWCSEAPDVCR